MYHYHGNRLALDRCPQCQIAVPNLYAEYGFSTHNSEGDNPRYWRVYCCASCGGAILACSSGERDNERITDIWPQPSMVSETVPGRARQYLTQAIASKHAPSGAVMLAASSIDAMLKEKGYKDGTLNKRIDQAATDHLITSEMAAWAHEIRLDANDQRHADEGADLPDIADAKKSIQFALALAEFLFVLPARVERGRKTA